jgi:hypothetical protein
MQLGQWRRLRGAYACTVRVCLQAVSAERMVRRSQAIPLFLRGSARLWAAA